MSTAAISTSRRRDSITAPPARAGAARQRVNLGDGHQVHVAADRMLQARGGDGELEGRLERPPVEQRVDQPGGEGIPGADPIDDRGDAIGLRDVEGGGGPDHAGPGVLGRRDRPALRERDGVELRKPARQLRCDGRVPGRVDAALRHGAPGRSDAEHLLGILLVADENVRLGHDPGHDVAGGSTPAPELGAIVEVDGDGGTSGASGPHRGQRRLGGGGRQRGRDARGVEPACTCQERRPVIGVGAGLGDARVGPVVDDPAGTLGGSGLQVVDAEAPRLDGDARCVDAEAAEEADRALAQVVRRHPGHEPRRDAEARERSRDVGLAAAEGRVQHSGLREPRRRRAPRDGA